MPPARRSDIIKLLEQLGASRDEDVLSAAHALSQAMVESGWTWDELLVPDSSATPTRTTEVETQAADADGQRVPPASEEIGSVEQVARTPAPNDDAPESNETQQDVLGTIMRLLAREDISDETRADLVSFRSDLEQGGLAEMDSKYVHALAKRLGVAA